ncbi:Cof-type HAD-IIB family hydrolase [Lactobacillus xylocopicola]|uniref:Hydrolase n=1 Tax=Lactobacillus xylocopicola TaxID=2976676 RepID=A0ABM8BGU1_9LACO|nr:Cof-type HAD-IIB family hydrolase [Lactobacillus xylocopicola]BDR60321.1 hydrolase [Lactobacillus xylocopicola]
MIKLVAIDVDDTLLNSQGKLLESTKRTIKQAVEQQVKVVLCSGRPLAGVKHFLQELNIVADDQYVITFNGSVIESVTGKVLKKSGLSFTTALEIEQYSQRHDVAFNFVDANSRIITSNHHVGRITVVQAWENSAGILVRATKELSKDNQIIKAVFGDEQKKLDDIENDVIRQFGAENYVVRAADNFLEVMHKNVDKGAALKFLTAKLGLVPSDVMVIGDERNDIPMFNFAGTAVVMGNGSDLAKEHADYVTSSNDADGIEQAFNEFVFK